MAYRRKILFVLLLISFSFSSSKNNDGDDKKEQIEIPDPITDIYAVGYETLGTKSTAKIWENVVATPLTDGTNNTSANSVYVSNDDVYVVGAGSNGSVDIGMI